MCIYSTARAHCVSHFVACLVPLPLFKSHANLFVLIVLIVLYCCGLFYVSLCVSCCPCHCVREAFAVVCDLCCSFMLKPFYFNFWLSLLWFSTSKFFYNTFSCHHLFLSSGSFFFLLRLPLLQLIFVCLLVALILCVLLSFWASVVSCHVQCAVSVCHCATSHALLSFCSVCSVHHQHLFLLFLFFSILYFNS